MTTVSRGTRAAHESSDEMGQWAAVSGAQRAATIFHLFQNVSSPPSKTLHSGRWVMLVVLVRLWAGHVGRVG